VITREEEPRTSGEDARKTLVATLALHESGMTQKPVQIQY